MFVRQPQFRNASADIQIFNAWSAEDNTTVIQTWNKPPGVSFVYFLLIGGGGSGNYSSGQGGGSGAVTVWFGCAQTVPDTLQIKVAYGGGSGGVSPQGGGTTFVYYWNGGAYQTLLRANGGTSTSAASATSASDFTNSGFYQSVAGQSGSSSNMSRSTTTFLTGGTRGTNIEANYGYNTYGTVDTPFGGIFQFQPVIVANGAIGPAPARGGTGCGGGYAATIKDGIGGDGLVLIASW